MPASSSGSLTPSASVSSDVGEVVNVIVFKVPLIGTLIDRLVTSALSLRPSASVSFSVGSDPYVLTSVPSVSLSPSVSAEPVPFGRVVIRAVRFVTELRRSPMFLFPPEASPRIHARTSGVDEKFAGYTQFPVWFGKYASARVHVARTVGSGWGEVATYPTTSEIDVPEPFRFKYASKLEDENAFVRFATSRAVAVAGWAWTKTIGAVAKASRNGTVVPEVETVARPASTTVPSERTWFPASTARYETSSAAGPPASHFSSFTWNVWSVTP